MRRPLLGYQQLIANFDPDSDQLEIVGMVPGPAGTAPLVLDELIIDIDVANPSSVALITVDQVSEAAGVDRLRTILARLVGDESCEGILALTRADQPARVRVGGGSSTQPGPREMVLQDVARLAIAVAQADAPGLLAPERSIGVLEAAGLAGRVGLLDHMSWLSAEIPPAAAALEAAATNGFPEPGSELARRVIEICSQSVQYIPAKRDRDRVQQLAERLALPSRTGRPQLHSVGGEAPVAVEQGHVAPESLTALMGAPSFEFRRTTNDEFEARVASWGERTTGWWVRAFSAAGDLPLALVAFSNEGGDGVARFLLPPHHQEQLQLDVVDDPLEPRLSRSAIRKPSATPAPASSRPRSAKRQRRICSANRPCSAAVSSS